MPKSEKRRGSPDQVLKEALKEKDFLVKEVHHRVRNNLQLIISLLDLQASFLNDAKQCAAFKESQNRIKALYFIYDTIDRTEDASRLDCRQFLDRLFESLFLTYGVKSLASRLKVADDTQVSPASASLVGLILNELISNSIQHAFPGGRTGSIEVDMRPNGANTAVTLRDDGIGLAVGFDFMNSQTLGFQLVTKLVGQLKGSIDQLAGPGTAFLIQFPSAD
jgi:two-component sensor histidine kinase